MGNNGAEDQLDIEIQQKNKVGVIMEQMPFFEMLKEFNKQQDYIIESIKIYNKDASKNKFQLKNTLK